MKSWDEADLKMPPPLAAAANELQAPLALISGLALQLLDTNCDKRQREYLERIVLSSDRLLRVVQSLADSYCLDQAALELEPVNVRHVAEEVAHEITPYGKKINRHVHVAICRSVKLVVANKLLLKEALFNVTDSALQGATKDIIISARRSKEKTRISVANQDAGYERAAIMLRDSLARQMQPLASVAHSSGLGLYIAQQLAEAMGGNVHAWQRRQGIGVGLEFYNSTQLALL